MDLSRTHGRLEKFYQRYVHPGDSQINFKAFDGGQYTESELRRGRHAWALRTNDEYRSMVGFSELTYLCAEMRAPLDVVALASRIIRVLSQTKGLVRGASGGTIHCCITHSSYPPVRLHHGESPLPVGEVHPLPPERLQQVGVEDEKRSREGQPGKAGPPF